MSHIHTYIHTYTAREDAGQLGVSHIHTYIHTYTAREDAGQLGVSFCMLALSDGASRVMITGIKPNSVASKDGRYTCMYVYVYVCMYVYLCV